MAQHDLIASEDLGLRAGRHGEPASLEDMGLEEVESFLIKKALSRYGNVSRAAKALGLSRSALYRRLQRYGL
jgi:transcriptional regulator of acetoin/glycerol metabolism